MSFQVSAKSDPTGPPRILIFQEWLIESQVDLDLEFWAKCVPFSGFDVIDQST